jgi:hypothetical protein
MSEHRKHTLDLSRRGLLHAAAVTVGAGALIGAAGAAEAAPKFSQALAKYQPTPHGAQRCAVCNQFVAPASCKTIDGKISPNGWCVMFAAKAG